jgi:hypothetical protein
MHRGSRRSASITHGDSNLNNILPDENENIHGIDFRGICGRNIVAGVGRSEPLLSIRMSRMGGPDDAVYLLEFLARPMEVSPLALIITVTPRDSRSAANTLFGYSAFGSELLRGRPTLLNVGTHSIIIETDFLASKGS